MRRANSPADADSIQNLDDDRFPERSKCNCDGPRHTRSRTDRALRPSLMSSPSRILFLVSTLRQSGPTMQLRNVVRHLDRSAFEPIIVTLSTEPADSMLDSFRELGVRVESLSMSRSRSLVERRWRPRIERAAGVSLDAGCMLHSQGVRADMISARLHGMPRVATVHNYPYDDYPLRFGRLQGSWMAWRHLQAFAALPGLVACSASLANELRRHGLRAAVIRNGVDTARFHAELPSARMRARARLGLPADARVGVCLGSLIPRKNPLAVVRAVVRSELRELAMIFVGGGVLDPGARREAGEDARIRFVGHCEDVLPYLQVADFLVSASRSEGLPTAVLEALSCGLPAVLSDIEPHREILKLLPGGGELCDPDRDAAFTAAIERAAGRAGGAREQLAARAGETFGAERVSRGYQELYRQALATQACGDRS